MKGKAILAVDSRTVEVRPIEIGQPGEWDLLVELERSAISAGTESYVVASQKAGEAPSIPGYAPIARVVSAGDRAGESWSVGQRVSYFGPSPPHEGLMRCGGHLGRAIVNVDPSKRDLLGSDCYVVRVPDALSSEHAAFGGIAAVSCMGASLSRVEVGDRVLVLGQGLIGNFAAQHMHLRGAEVAVADIHPNRLDIARRCGADHVLDCSTGDLVQAVRALWPQGADVIMDSTGNYGLIERSVDAIRYRGRYVFLAWCKGANFNLPKFHNRVFEAYFPWTLQGHRVLNCWRLMATGALKVEPIITHRLPYTEAPRAYDMIYTDPQGHLGIVLDWTAANED